MASYRSKIIPLFGSRRRRKKQRENGDTLISQKRGLDIFRQLVIYVRDKAKERHLGWSLIPALITMRFLAKENMRAIRSVFDGGMSGDQSASPDLLRDFLELRRYFTATLIHKASENWKISELNSKGSKIVDEILDEMQFLSDNHSWDWVSFHESEFELFLQLATNARFASAKFILNRIKRDYLDSVLGYDHNFWNMQNAIRVYRLVVRLIREKQSDHAEHEFLQFFSQNDEAIIQYYTSQISKRAARGLDEAGSVSHALAYGTNIPFLPQSEIDRVLRQAFTEDQALADVTTHAVFEKFSLAHGRIFVKEEGIVCGVSLAEQALKFFDHSITVLRVKQDGERVQTGDTILKFEGDIRSIMRSERIALNFLAFMSSIATRTAQVVSIANSLGVKVLDTRKTIPGLRLVSKYAVVKGGGYNHRLDLSAMGLIKDNHIAHAGSVSAAIRKFKKSTIYKQLEVEIDTINQLYEALNEKPDMILLDNMDNATMKEAARIIREFNQKNKTQITSEASGGFTLENLSRIQGTGVDFVSLGSITNTIIPLDFSLEII